MSETDAPEAALADEPVTRSPAIGRATLLRGATRFKDQGIPNLGETYRGQILTSTGVQQAIIKDIPLRELGNEVLSFALAKELNLSVPSAFLTFADSDAFQAQHAPQIQSGGSLLFASVDVKTPSVAQILNPSIGAPDLAVIRGVIDALIASKELGGFYGFDAWAANTDRHIGNILLGSGNKPWLIDHGRCFTGDKWTSIDLVPDGIVRNRLKEWLTPSLKQAQKGQYAADVAVLTARITKLNVRAVAVANGLPTLFGDEDFNALVTYLGDRVQHTPRIAADSLQLVI